jgi:hypothetical protein
MNPTKRFLVPFSAACRCSILVSWLEVLINFEEDKNRVVVGLWRPGIHVITMIGSTPRPDLISMMLSMVENP